MVSPRAWVVGLVTAGALLALRLPATEFQPADPDWMPAKLYFAGGALRPRVMDLVRDPSAPTGQAGYSRAGVKEAGALADSYTYENVPGRYRTTFYFKVADNQTPEVVVEYFVWGAVGADPRAGTVSPWSIPVRAADFREPNVYQTFTYDWEYYGVGFMVVSGTWLGNADLWWGGFETKLVEPFDDDALLEKWQHPPAQKFYVPFPPEGAGVPPVIPPDAKPPAGPPRVHLVEGMYFDRFGVGEAVRSIAGATLSESETISGGQVADICPKFPSTEQLFEHNVLVLANVDIRRLGLLRRYAIREFVRRGGGLLILGGPWTFGRCALRGTWIDQLLPVTVDGKSDWVQLPPGSALRWADVAPDSLHSGTLEGNPCVRHVHRADVRDGGRVFLEAHDRPVLVGGQLDRGRVAAFLGTPMGDAGVGHVGFWEDQYWPAAMAQLLRWLAANKELQ